MLYDDDKDGNITHAMFESDEYDDECYRNETVPKPEDVVRYALKLALIGEASAESLKNEIGISAKRWHEIYNMPLFRHQYKKAADTLKNSISGYTQLYSQMLMMSGLQSMQRIVLDDDSTDRDKIAAFNSIAKIAMTTVNNDNASKANDKMTLTITSQNSDTKVSNNNSSIKLLN